MRVTKRKFGRRVLSAILVWALLMGMLPSTFAIEITTGRFNPNTSELQLSFRLQLTQPLEIRVYVQDSNGETQVGNLFTRVVLEGYEGDLMDYPHLPEDAISPFVSAPLVEEPADRSPAKPLPEGTDDLFPEPPVHGDADIDPEPMSATDADTPSIEADEAGLLSDEDVENNVEAPEAEPEGGVTPSAKNGPMLELGELTIVPKTAPGAISLMEAVAEPDGDDITDRTPGLADSVRLFQKAPGEYTLVWDGSINGASVLSDDRKKDTTEARVEVRPLGYPENNVPCQDVPAADGGTEHIHGEDYSWTQRFVESSTLFIDYRVATGEDARYLMVTGSTSNQLVHDMLEHFKNGGSLCDLIAENPDAGNLVLDSNAGDPVNMVDGNYHSSYTDLRVEGQIPTTFMRLYNSRYAGGSLGKGFTHSFEYKLETAPGLARVILPYGEQLVFPRIRPDLGGGYHSLQDSGFSLEDDGSGYLMTHKGGATFFFSADGKLQWIRNPSGVEVAGLHYSGDLLTGITGVAGSFTLAWNDGHISSVTDSAGRAVRYSYQGDLLETVENPDGDTLTFGYDSSGYVNEARDFEGELYLENTYDAKGRVTAQTFYNAGVPTHYRVAYDDTAHTTSFTDHLGRTTVYYYDEYRNIQYISDPDGDSKNTYDNFTADSLEDNQGNKTAYTYDDRGNVLTITTPDGGVTTYTYTSDGSVASVTDAEGGVQRYAYDGNRNLLLYTDQRGNETRYEYNALGLVTKRIDALNNEINYTYDTAGRLLSETDAEGGKTSCEYDDLGRVTATHVKISDDETATTRYEYSASGKLLKTIDALGHETAYEYNGNGFTTKTIDALGGVTTTEYGINGQPLKTTDAMGGITSYSYNSDGLIEQVADPEGVTTTYAYDDKARVISVSDSAGYAAHYEYDSLDRLNKTIDAMGGVTTQTYDEMGRTKTITDQNNNTTTYFYDLLGRTVRVTDALSGETTYSYDLAGNLLATEDANGIVTYSAYDKLNRVATETDGEGNVTSYAYDGAGRVDHVIDALGGVTKYTYDLAGNILSQTGPDQNITAFRYDALGRQVERINADSTRTRTVYDPLSRVVERYDERGGKTVYTYDRNGNQLTVTDPMGGVTAYTYNRANQPLTVTYPDGGRISYAYNSRGLVEKVTDQRGFETATTYDALGRTKTVTDTVGILTEYFYDPVGNTTKVTRDGHTVSESVYDALGHLVEERDGLGHSAFTSYDKVGNILASIDREGNETGYTYDKNYRITEVRNALNGVQRTEYDKLGRTVKTVDPKGNLTAYTYDGVGNLLSVTDALGSVSRNTYDVMGRLVAARDKLGAVTTYGYDEAGNLLTVTDHNHATETYRYDANGNVTLYTNRNNEWVGYAYDTMNRKVKETNQLNHSQWWEYDLSGNMTAAIDGNRNRTEYAYDGLNRLLSMTDPEGAVAEYTYNYLGKTATFTAYGGNGQKGTTRYSYDGAGNLLTETSPLGGVTANTYDKMGNVLTRTDENGVVTEYVYDRLYRQVSRTDPDGSAAYSYDANGNMTEARDGNSAVGFTYDALNRATAVKNEDGTKTAYSYDANGNRLSITYPDGKAVTSTYDLLGNVTALTDHDGKGILYTRDAEGRVTKESHNDGSTTEYAYNAAGLLTQQKEVDRRNSTGREILYGYDDAGNLKSEQRTGVDVDKRDENVRYYYDRANRLIKTTVEGQTTEYRYDLAGNLLDDGKYTYAYDPQNRLLTKAGPEGTTTYEYDAAGNLLKEVSPGGTVSYTYNAQNKLVKGEKSTGESSSYSYNALGARITNVQIRKNRNVGYQNIPLNNGSQFIRDYMAALSDGRATWQRVWETEAGTTVQNDFETVTKHYIVDYLSLANRDIMVKEEGSFTTRYVYDQNSRRISAEFGYAPGTRRGQPGENIASDTAAELGKVWYRTSHLGSALFAVDADGEVVSHVIYDPWGNPLTETYTDTNFSGLDNLNNFTGYTWDETLGLYFAQNRFYDPRNHRFIQEDPVKDGVNWYGYVANNPLNFLDPLGLAAAWNTLITQYNNGVESDSDKIPNMSPTVIKEKKWVRDIMNDLDTWIWPYYNNSAFIEKTDDRNQSYYEASFEIGYSGGHLSPTKYFFNLYCDGRVVYYPADNVKSTVYNAATNINGKMFMTREEFFKFLGIDYERSINVYRVKNNMLADIAVGAAVTVLTGVATSGVSTAWQIGISVLAGGATTAGGSLLKQEDGLYVTFIEMCQVDYQDEAWRTGYRNYIAFSWESTFRIKEGYSTYENSGSPIYELTTTSNISMIPHF